jgi:hypothetical protein
MSVILLKLAPWLAGVVALLGLGGWAGYHLNPYPARYKALEASYVIERAHGEEAVRQVLSAQLAQAQTVTRNNQAAMVILATQNAQTAADRDATVARVHRLEQLLSAAAARAASSRVVSQAGDRPATPAAGGDPSADEVGDLLIAARDEAKRNASRLNALIAEVKPQVEP